MDGSLKGYCEDILDGSLEGILDGNCDGILDGVLEGIGGKFGRHDLDGTTPTHTVTDLSLPQRNDTTQTHPVIYISLPQPTHSPLSTTLAKPHALSSNLATDTTRTHTITVLSLPQRNNTTLPVIKAPGSADISKMNSPTKPTAHHVVAIKAPGSKLRRVEAAIASTMVAMKAPLFVQGTCRSRDRCYSR
jgi:hypothetical protein